MECQVFTDYCVYILHVSMAWFVRPSHHQSATSLLAVVSNRQLARQVFTSLLLARQIPNYIIIGACTCTNLKYIQVARCIIGTQVHVSSVWYKYVVSTYPLYIRTREVKVPTYLPTYLGRYIATLNGVCTCAWSD